MDHQSNNRVEYRWLGGAGVELRAGDRSLLIDPYVTRVPWYGMFFRHVHSNQELVKNIVTQADNVLVTHAHIDHLLDVATVVESTGASVYGSPNICRLLRTLGCEESKIHSIAAGDCFSVDDFRMKVFPARHFPVPGFLPGKVNDLSKPPRTARQYRMDTCFSYLVEIEGLRILVDSGKRESQDLPADILIIHPFYGAAYYRRLLADVRPTLIIPNHWDNFMAPFSEKELPLAYPHDWVSSLVRTWRMPPFEKTIHNFGSNVAFFIPQIFEVYDLGSLIDFKNWKPSP